MPPDAMHIDPLPSAVAVPSPPPALAPMPVPRASTPPSAQIAREYAVQSEQTERSMRELYARARDNDPALAGWLEKEWPATDTVESAREMLIRHEQAAAREQKEIDAKVATMDAGSKDVSAPTLARIPTLAVDRWVAAKRFAKNATADEWLYVLRSKGVVLDTAAKIAAAEQLQREIAERDTVPAAAAEAREPEYVPPRPARAAPGLPPGELGGLGQASPDTVQRKKQRLAERDAADAAEIDRRARSDRQRNRQQLQRLASEDAQRKADEQQKKREADAAAQRERERVAEEERQRQAALAARRKAEADAAAQRERERVAEEERQRQAALAAQRERERVAEEERQRQAALAARQKAEADAAAQRVEAERRAELERIRALAARQMAAGGPRIISSQPLRPELPVATQPPGGSRPGRFAAPADEGEPVAPPTASLWDAMEKKPAAAPQPQPAPPTGRLDLIKAPAASKPTNVALQQVLAVKNALQRPGVHGAIVNAAQPNLGAATSQPGPTKAAQPPGGLRVISSQPLRPPRLPQNLAGVPGAMEYQRKVEEFYNKPETRQKMAAMAAEGSAGPILTANREKHAGLDYTDASRAVQRDIPVRFTSDGVVVKPNPLHEEAINTRMNRASRAAEQKWLDDLVDDHPTMFPLNATNLDADLSTPLSEVDKELYAAHAKSFPTAQQLGLTKPVARRARAIAAQVSKAYARTARNKDDLPTVESTLHAMQSDPEIMRDLPQQPAARAKALSALKQIAGLFAHTRDQQAADERVEKWLDVPYKEKMALDTVYLYIDQVGLDNPHTQAAIRKYEALAAITDAEMRRRDLPAEFREAFQNQVARRKRLAAERANAARSRRA